MHVCINLQTTHKPNLNKSYDGMQTAPESQSYGSARGALGRD